MMQRMGWVGIELRAYEKRRQDLAFRSEHLLMRGRLVEMQGHGRWADLLGQFRKIVIEMNREAGRNLLRDRNSPTEHYEIEREVVEVILSVDYDPNLFRVTCSLSSGDIDNREFELEVRDVGGNDKTVWVDRQTGRREKDEEIAKFVIRNLMQV